MISKYLESEIIFDFIYIYIYIYNPYKKIYIITYNIWLK